jgi:uncharacterized protein DUF3147
MSLTLISLKALIGGLAVVAFSLIGQAGHPKRFAGLFSAAPSVALASLGITVITKRADGAIPYAEGMLIGSAGVLAYIKIGRLLMKSR